MKLRICIAALALLALSPAAAAAHPCAADARARAEPLLRHHVEAGDLSFDIDGEVALRPPVRALNGPGAFDVLEVWGYVYKASYRMRFLYAQIPGSCVLMGQEILENSDPY